MTLCKNCNTETSNPKFCSRSCSAIHTNKTRTLKRRLNSEGLPNIACKNCGKALSYNKIYCSNECRLTFTNSELINKLLNRYYENKAIQFSTGTWAKKYLLEVHNSKCSECGIGEIYNNKPLTLEVDHINGRCHNNVIENLRLLCPNCHSQTENYKAKNPTSDHIARYKL